MTSIDIDLEADSHYFEFDNWVTEPSLYLCTEGQLCYGKLETAHGYCLACMRCCEEEQAT